MGAFVQSLVPLQVNDAGQYFVPAGRSSVQQLLGVSLPQHDRGRKDVETQADVLGDPVIVADFLARTLDGIPRPIGSTPEQLLRRPRRSRLGALNGAEGGIALAAQ